MTQFIASRKPLTSAQISGVFSPTATSRFSLFLEIYTSRHRVCGWYQVTESVSSSGCFSMLAVSLWETPVVDLVGYIESLGGRLAPVWGLPLLMYTWYIFISATCWRRALFLWMSIWRILGICFWPCWVWSSPWPATWSAWAWMTTPAESVRSSLVSRSQPGSTSTSWNPPLVLLKPEFFLASIASCCLTPV